MPCAPGLFPVAALVAAVLSSSAQPGSAQIVSAQAGPDASPTDRRIPGVEPDLPPPVLQSNPGALRAPPPSAFPVDHIPVPDRWRLADTLGVPMRWYDPYNQNTLKGDRPLKGHDDLFIVLNAISDTVIEPRSFPVPVGVQTTQNPGSNDSFGRANSFFGAQTLLFGAALIKGSTAFKPPEYEVRLTLAANFNYVAVNERRLLYVEPSRPTTRSDTFIGVQEAFVDYHLRNVSDRYDFDSIRIGIQPFSADFRGFLFQDNQFGIRLFGNRDGNRFQYNLAIFKLLEKDSNSGLNDITQRLRDDMIFLANLYRQDLPLPGMTSQVTVIYNRDREQGRIHLDDNGFPVRPALIGNLRTRDFDVVYLGLNADGHIGRVNLTASAYAALGEDRNSIFTGQPAQIRAWFVAAEPSMDFDWVRIRVSGLYASGDGDPHDNVEHGFDAIFENPQFAGADTSYWIRQSIPFAGGGRAVGINGRNGVLNALRSSKDEGQSNFNNPGTVLIGTGADFDLTPTLRVSANINHLWFADTAIISALRIQDGISTNIGWDVSSAVIYRPNLTQNLVLRGSIAVFAPGSGFGALFTNAEHDRYYYSALINAVAAF